MTKELDLVNGLIEGIDDYEKQTGRKNPPAYISREVLVEIQQALQRLEAIDNAKPSEALNYLCNFINEMTYCLEHPKEYAKGYDKEIFYKYKLAFETIIKQALIKAQEQEKVLEIIKKCVMPLVNIDDECVWDNEGYEYLVPKKEDLILLKRYFENGRNKTN